MLAVDCALSLSDSSCCLMHSMILGHWYGLDCRIVDARAGEVPSRTGDLVRHFEDERSPVMIGGGVLAWTLLGLAVGDTEVKERMQCCVGVFRIM
jgi:hypothetical protein